MTNTTEFLIGQIAVGITSGNNRLILEQLKKDNCDINQYGRAKKTPLIFAINSLKPDYVQLFLLMGANPNQACEHGSPFRMAINMGNSTKNDRTKLEKLNEVFTILRENIKIKIDESIRYDERLENDFIDFIEQGNADSLWQMINSGFIFDDSKTYGHGNYSALALAANSRSFEVTQLLVEQGAIISDDHVKKFLQINRDKSWCKLISRLIQLEKQKQIDIMESFCAAEGVLKNCIDRIKEIVEQYEETVHKLDKEALISQLSRDRFIGGCSASSSTQSINSSNFQNTASFTSS